MHDRLVVVALLALGGHPAAVEQQSLAVGQAVDDRDPLEGGVLFGDHGAFQAVADTVELLVDPALCGAASIERVLIVGGGDGGTARECLRHAGVRQLDLVEIDGLVVEWSQQHLPSIGGAAWSDPRLQLTVGDGIAWVANAPDASYDVVIVDGSDPAGPAEGLFNRAFFEHCRRILRPGGVFVTQSESPEAFRQVHIDTVRLLRQVFGHADPLYGWVPMYPSGWWSWTFAAVDGPRYRQPDAARAAAVAEGCQIWSPRWQRGGFEAMPAFVERALA